MLKLMGQKYIFYRYSEKLIVFQLSDHISHFPLRHDIDAEGGEHELVVAVPRLEAIHSETLEDMVVYRSDADVQVWVRPKAMFMDKVGELFENGEYFVGDLIFAGEIVKVPSPVVIS